MAGGPAGGEAGGSRGGAFIMWVVEDAAGREGRSGKAGAGGEGRGRTPARRVAGGGAGRWVARIRAFILSSLRGLIG